MATDYLHQEMSKNCYTLPYRTDNIQREWNLFITPMLKIYKIYVVQEILEKDIWKQCSGTKRLKWTTVYQSSAWHLLVQTTAVSIQGGDCKPSNLVWNVIGNFRNLLLQFKLNNMHDSEYGHRLKLGSKTSIIKVCFFTMG